MGYQVAVCLTRSFEKAESFLLKFLGDDYDENRGEYYIIEV